MAKVEFDKSIGAFRGKVGGLIYREQHGQTVVLSGYKRKDRPSAAQREVRARFEAAQAYAAKVLAHPLKRERYRQLAAERKRPPNTLLIANFLTPPTVERVDLAEFDGRAGDVICVLAADAIEVVGVTVAACDATGRVLESGAAKKDHDVWEYRCTTALDGTATKLEITAENRAGAKGIATVAL